MSVPKTIGFIGDLHCGSHHGLWPIDDLPGGKEGKKYKGVRYLNRCYNDLVESWPKLDLLILMGDLVDGKQKKSSGCGIFTSDMSAQAEGAIEILKPLVAKATKTIRVYGTPYHEEFDNCLGVLDAKLGVRRMEQVMNLQLGEHVLNIAHHPASGAILYAGTAVDKEAVWSTVAAAEKKVPHARWIVRAHKHEWIMQETRFKTICITPCFELPTAHAIKQNYWRFQPTIGGLLMHADESHDSGYRFTASLYDIPMPDVISPDRL